MKKFINALSVRRLVAAAVATSLLVYLLDDLLLLLLLPAAAVAGGVVYLRLRRRERRHAWVDGLRSVGAGIIAFPALWLLAAVVGRAMEVAASALPQLALVAAIVWLCLPTRRPRPVTGGLCCTGVWVREWGGLTTVAFELVAANRDEMRAKLIDLLGELAGVAEEGLEFSIFVLHTEGQLEVQKLSLKTKVEAEYIEVGHATIAINEAAERR